MPPSRGAPPRAIGSVLGCAAGIPKGSASPPRALGDQLGGCRGWHPWGRCAWHCPEHGPISVSTVPTGGTGITGQAAAGTQVGLLGGRFPAGDGDGQGARPSRNKGAAPSRGFGVSFLPGRQGGAGPGCLERMEGFWGGTGGFCPRFSRPQGYAAGVPPAARQSQRSDDGGGCERAAAARKLWGPRFHPKPFPGRRNPFPSGAAPRWRGWWGGHGCPETSVREKGCGWRRAGGWRCRREPWPGSLETLAQWWEAAEGPQPSPAPPAPCPAPLRPAGVLS